MISEKERLKNKLDDVLGIECADENEIENVDDNDYEIIVQDRDVVNNNLTVVENPDFNDNDDIINSDINYARENLYKIMEKGNSALDEIIQIAKESEEARSFEVVGQLVKTLTDVNKELVGIQKTVSDIKKKNNKISSTNNITNAVFVGSTSELQKMISNKNKNDN